jgi:hypothetical protein
MIQNTTALIKKAMNACVAPCQIIETNYRIEDRPSNCAQHKEQIKEGPESHRCVCVCVYYMLQAVQSKLEVFLRTRGRVGTPLTKTQGKESEKV